MSTAQIHATANHAASSTRGQLNGILFAARFAAAVTCISALPAIAGLGLSPLTVGIETRISQVREAGPRALTTGLIL